MTTPSLSPVFTAILLCVLGFATACSIGGEPGATGTSGQAAFLAIEPSSIVMTIENRVTQPLLDIRIAIRPIGGATEFTKMITRLESRERRTLSLGEFSGRDGTPFSLRIVRPRDIAVTAVSLTNEKFAMTIPWR